MQINSINSTNFGMAMKIKPEAAEYLKSRSSAELEVIEKVGEKLKDSKIWHLEIGKDGQRILTSPYANKYLGGSFHVRKPNDQFLQMRPIWMGESVGAVNMGDEYTTCIDMLSRENAMAAYKKLQNLSGIEHDAEMVKLLDEAAIRKSGKHEVTNNPPLWFKEHFESIFGDLKMEE